MSAGANRRPLAILVALLVVSAVAAPGAARAGDADPWYGRDKRLHFEATSTLALLGYAGASMATEDRPTRVTVSLTLALGAGVGKELWDLTGRGDASWRDLTWDVAGAATGALVAIGIDWLLRRGRPGRAGDRGAWR